MGTHSGIGKCFVDVVRALQQMVVPRLRLPDVRMLGTRHIDLPEDTAFPELCDEQVRNETTRFTRCQTYLPERGP